MKWLVLAILLFPAISLGATSGWVRVAGGTAAKNTITRSGDNAYMDITSADASDTQLPIIKFQVAGFICFDSDTGGTAQEGAIADIYSMCVTPPTGNLTADNNVCIEIGTLQAGVVATASLTGAAISGGKQLRCIFNIPPGMEVYPVMDNTVGSGTARFRAGGH